jgi:conjugal transfer/type IV secretion protein DotA/TraY
MAQSQSNVTIGEIQNAANRSGDKSMSMLQMVFGDVVHNPLAGGSGGIGDGMISSVFLVLNSCILAVGVIWAVYIFVTGLMSTAQDGEMLGQKKSSAWFVIRMGTGFCSLVPIFGGYCGAQIIMLWGAMMGVGIANLSQDAAIAVLHGGGSMVVTPASPTAHSLAKYLLEANLCSESVNAALASMPSDAGVSADTSEIFNSISASKKVVLMNRNGLSCGGAEVKFEDPEWGSIGSAHATALTAMQASLNAAAQQFVGAITHEASPPDLQAAISSTASQYEIAINNASKESKGQINELSNRIDGDLRRDGWLMMGTWYQTFAQANTRFTKAINATATGVPATPPDSLPYPATYQKVLAAYDMQAAQSSSTALANSPVKNISAAGSDDRNFVQRVFDSGSLGQQITNSIIGLNSENSAGGATNPIVGMKNLGDSILNAGTTAVAAWTAFKVVDKTAQKSVVGEIANKMTGWGGITEGLMESVGPFVYMTIMALFFFGAMLSIYIPMVPFIIWYGGVITWLAIVGEGVIASPLWGMAHLDGDGDGLGQRSTHGYVFLLNVLFRPVLMLLGLILGGAIVIVAGTALNPMFASAMANAQFDSWTGVISIVGFIAIYVSLSLTLIHTSFNLIHVVPDQVLAWVGGQIGNRLGQDTDERAKQVFVGGVHNARTAASNSIPTSRSRNGPSAAKDNGRRERLSTTERPGSE